MWNLRHPLRFQEATIMTASLHDKLISIIDEEGPIPLDQFMALALTDPDHGYYSTQTAIGKDGDFITAPEISQMFGELCGLWGIDQIINQGLTEDAAWLELGPGRGTLMSDVIRVLSSALPAKDDLWTVHLVEVHPTLKKIQRDKLDNITDLYHHTDLSNLPEKPLLFLANEFFDALPIRQFIARQGQWYERLVSHENHSLKITTSTKPADETISGNIHPSCDYEILEYCPSQQNIIKTISDHINTYGGAALIIDYGKDNAVGDSLQAVRDHKPVYIFDEPGQCDLSAWVDFSAIKDTATNAGAKVFGPQTQGDFLKQLGLYQRAEQLALGAEPDERRKIAAAVDRLSSPAQMGGAFKVMAILPASHPAKKPQDIAGFEPIDKTR